MLPTESLPPISVCIPVRNGEDALAHTLSNLLLRSGYPPDRFEVILGDHDSRDGTREIIADWTKRYANVRSVSVPFTGRCRAAVRNATIREAQGETAVAAGETETRLADLLVRLTHEALPPASTAVRSSNRDRRSHT